MISIGGGYDGLRGGLRKNSLSLIHEKSFHPCSESSVMQAIADPQYLFSAA
jgi:hypothetical protein